MSYTKQGELKINWRCQNRKCKTYMTTIGKKFLVNTNIPVIFPDSMVKEYPPSEHQLSHDSNPMAASISQARQKVKSDAVLTNNKPSQVQFLASLCIYSYLELQSGCVI